MAHLGSQVAHLEERRRVGAPGNVKELGVWIVGRMLVGGAHLRMQSHLARTPHTW